MCLSCVKSNRWKDRRDCFQYCLTFLCEYRMKGSPPPPPFTLTQLLQEWVWLKVQTEFKTCLSSEVTLLCGGWQFSASVWTLCLSASANWKVLFFVFFCFLCASSVIRVKSGQSDEGAQICMHVLVTPGWNTIQAFDGRCSFTILNGFFERGEETSWLIQCGICVF